MNILKKTFICLKDVIFSLWVDTAYSSQGHTVHTQVWLICIQNQGEMVWTSRGGSSCAWRLENCKTDSFFRGRRAWRSCMWYFRKGKQENLGTADSKDLWNRSFHLSEMRLGNESDCSNSGCDWDQKDSETSEEGWKSPARGRLSEIDRLNSQLSMLWREQYALLLEKDAVLMGLNQSGFVSL